MFNWMTAPTFAVMLLFWLLAAYVLTRSPRGLVSLTAVGASIAAAAYLLGQGMQANADTVSEWRRWEHSLYWGAVLAPVLWHSLTAMLLSEQGEQRLRTYLLAVGYPLTCIVWALGLICLTAAYVDGWLFQWTAPEVVPPTLVVYAHYHLREGPLYPAFVALLLLSTLGAALNVALGWRWTLDAARRARFAWLAVTAALFITAANTLGLASWGALNFAGDWAIVPSHLLLGAGMVTMAWNVAAYSLLLRGQVIRRDALYFLTSLGIVTVVYAAVLIALAHGAYSFHLLVAVVAVLILVVLSHALIDLSRRALDHLFFSGEVRQLRSGLSDAAFEAALTTDLGEVLQTTRREIDAISNAHFVHLTEQALRRLNAPAGLAGIELLACLPWTLSKAAPALGAHSPDLATPLQQAQLLRETLVQAIDRLKPAPDSSSGSPGALQYEILRQEYILGRPNKQIVAGLSISESTFHRNRREAIAAVARELARGEEMRGTAAPVLRKAEMSDR